MTEKDLVRDTWCEEAESAINDIRKHVKSATISRQLKNDHRRIFINITTLENDEYCVVLSAAGFRVVGKGHNNTALLHDQNMWFESIYTLLNHVSKKYRESFGGELMHKLLNLAKQSEG